MNGRGLGRLSKIGHIVVGGGLALFFCAPQLLNKGKGNERGGLFVCRVISHG